MYCIALARAQNMRKGDFSKAKVKGKRVLELGAGMVSDIRLLNVKAVLKFVGDDNDAMADAGTWRHGILHAGGHRSTDRHDRRAAPLAAKLRS